MWTPVPKSLDLIISGGLRLKIARTYNFQIPDIIPPAARELILCSIL